MAKQFNRNTLYYFNYRDPKTEHLEWDTKPLVFPLSFTDGRTLGINLHWITPKLRRPFVEFLIARSIRLKSRRKLARLAYKTIKDNPQLGFTKQAIRSYLNNRITQVKILKRKEIQDFFLPRKVDKKLFVRHRARKRIR